jgi:integrase
VLARLVDHRAGRPENAGRWQARYPDPLTNRRITAPTTFATKVDANLWLSKMEAGTIDPGHLQAQAAGERLDAYAAEWLETRQLKPRTRETYEGQYRLHISPTLGDAIVARLEPRVIRSWHAKLLRSDLGPVTVAKVYRLLRSILTTAVDDGLLLRNPCRIARAGVERSAERPIPTIDDLRRVSAALPERYAVVPWIAALGGLRKGEIFGLARRHIDIDRRTITVERALQEQNGVGAVFVAPKTHTSARTVVMPNSLVPLVAAHLHQFVGDHPDVLLFTNTAGRPIRATVWTKAWGEARTETALQGVRLHDFRRLAGTLSAQAGATLKELMDRLGHSSVQAALRYQHLVSERAARVADQIDGLL